MAELNGDLLICRRCRKSWDGAVYSQCPEDGEDLIETGDPASAARSEAPRTTLDSGRAGGTRIRITTGGAEFSIASGDLLELGRDEQYRTAAALAGHTNVSRYHAVLRFDGAKLFVTDTDSTNGTFVNGTPLTANTEYEVRPGQALRLAADVDVEVRWDR